MVFTIPRPGLLCDRRASVTVARTRPPDLVQAGAAQAGLGRQEVRDELPHDQTRRMPSARDQPAERAASRGHRIDVERLRIEILSERNDFIFADADASAVVRGPWLVVAEVPRAVIDHALDYLRVRRPTSYRSQTSHRNNSIYLRAEIVTAMLPQTAQTGG